jgi:hypothetical protein
VPVHDLQATILNRLGVDHTKLTFKGHCSFRTGERFLRTARALKVPRLTRAALAALPGGSVAHQALFSGRSSLKSHIFATGPMSRCRPTPREAAALTYRT